jgi:polyether ionophore transport system permease protein
VASTAETVPGRGSGANARPRRRAAGPVGLLARRAFRDARIRTIGFAYLFGVASILNPVAYRHTYSTLAERLAFANSFGHNKAVVLFYGKAYDLLTVGGYSAWRTGGILAILAAIYGLLAGVRALRAEEDAGRAELVLAAPVTRGTIYAGAIAGIAAGAALLWVAVLAGSVIGGLAAGGSAYLALAVVSMVPVFAGVGALVSQLAPTRRIALELGGAVVVVAFLLRVIADTSGSVGWLRWATPLGWAEELRPFTGAQPLVLLLPIAVSALALLGAWRIAARRDVGTALLPARDNADPRLWLLSSPTAQALRGELGGMAVWLVSVSAFALIVGVISKSISSAGISPQLQREFAKLGEGSIVTPHGYIGFAFIFFVLVLSLFSCSQVAAARHEESEQRLETLLALPVGRLRWLIGRLALAVSGTIVLALAAGLLAWAGAATQNVAPSLPRMLEAGANCLPTALLFLGIAVLAYAVVPRAGVGIAYGLVTVAFLWQLIGSLLGVPKWLVDITPFAHVASVPVQPLRAGAAAVMVAVGLITAAAGLPAFRHRDLTGA